MPKINPTEKQLQQAIEKATARGWKLIHVKSSPKDKPTTWICNRGHEVAAIPARILHGTNCKKCLPIDRREKRQRFLNEAKAIAESRGGRLVSKTVQTVNEKILWQCGQKHTPWGAPLHTVRRGSWCPDCCSAIGERICRAYFEAIFQKPFPTARPTWLPNPTTDMPLELDGFCEELGIAFEHQGNQHYKFMRHFHDSREEFEARASLDRYKEKICAKRGVKLIAIPSIPELMPLQDLEPFLKKAFAETKIQIPENFDWASIDLKKAYSPRTIELIQEMKDIAEAKGGKFLSDFYFGTNVNHKFQCSAGHTWETYPSVVRKGHWCEKCAKLKVAMKLRTPFSEIKAEVEKRSGKILSPESDYVNSTSKLTFQCDKGHEPWPATVGSIVSQGSWCDECAAIKRGQMRRSKRDLSYLQGLAKKKGGKCLATEYVTANTLCDWKCKVGHIWPAKPTTIVQGRWCPDCANIERGEAKKLTIKELQAKAAEHDGKCLSTIYIDAHAYYDWECAKNHTFPMSGAQVMRGHWCGYCAGNKKKTIEDMHAMAAKHGGKCLSTVYVNAKSDLNWECKEGHRWPATGDSVQQGKWCKECFKENNKGEFYKNLRAAKKK